MNIKHIDKECSVLVSSCDHYSDLWSPFFSLFCDNWMDCPFTVYLGCETKSFNKRGINVLSAKGQKIWSNCIREYLLQIDSKYVLLFLDDFFIKKRIDTNHVLSILNILKILNAAMIRIGKNKIGKKRGIHTYLNRYPEIAPIKKGANSRVTLQVSFWKKESLLALLREGESIWEFEQAASDRSDTFDGFYCTRKPIIFYGKHVIEKGKWFRDEARRYSKLDIGCDFHTRPVMTPSEMLLWQMKKAKSMLMSALPVTHQETANKWEKKASTLIKQFSMLIQ